MAAAAPTEMEAAAPAPPPPAVSANRLEFSFPGWGSTLKDISLDLPAGSRCVLAGSNGAGKTTLLQVGVRPLGQGPNKGS